VRAVNLRYENGVAHFDIALQAEGRQVIEGCTLPMPGDHNVSNALAAVAVARHLGMKRDEIREPRWPPLRRQPALHQGGRGGRRHHHRRLRPPPGRDRRRAAPRARPPTGPRHRRAPAAPLHPPVASLFEDFCTCFNEADVVAIAEVYAAGEAPIPGASRDDLVAGLIAHGHRHARAVHRRIRSGALVREQARPGDMVVCLGAGTISAWAGNLPGRRSGRRRDAWHRHEGRNGGRRMTMSLILGFIWAGTI
jgi:UDP-N-acetylmuramate--alanine ligase